MLPGILEEPMRSGMETLISKHPIHHPSNSILIMYGYKSDKTAYGTIFIFIVYLLLLFTLD